MTPILLLTTTVRSPMNHVPFRDHPSGLILPILVSILVVVVLIALGVWFL